MECILVADSHSELFRLVVLETNIKLSDLQTCTDGTEKYGIHSNGSGSLGKSPDFSLNFNY